MNGKCFEIGTIQAFLDGETSPELSLKLTNHVAGCDNCALLLAVAEEETSVVFSALDREFNSLVPTQRLWTRINESIAVAKSQTTFWEKVRSSLSVLTANPSLTVAASVLVFFGLFAAVWTFNPNAGVGFVESNSQSPAEKQLVAVVPINVTGSDEILQPSSTGPLTVGATNLSPEKLQKLVTTASYKEANIRPKAQYLNYVRPTETSLEYLPDEESYVKTIANLKQNIDGQKDVILNPSSRFAYERDMAVVNDAITKMKEVVRKNPKNQSAKQILYSSYQNKIDLLNSVAEREELMASLK